jgi:hypothetical protein
MLKSSCLTVSIPVLGDTDSPRFRKYCPYGTTPLPSQGSLGEEYGDQTVWMGIEANITLKGGPEPSVQTRETLLEFVALAAARLEPKNATPALCVTG